jgi:hypothetical protein
MIFGLGVDCGGVYGLTVYLTLRIEEQAGVAECCRLARFRLRRAMPAAAFTG